MNEERNKLGFSNRDNGDRYIDRFVHVQQNGISVHGVLKEIDKEKGCAYFNPSLVGGADGYLHIMQELPTKLDLPLTIIRPMLGTIEEYAGEYNARLKRSHKKNKEGKE